MTRFSITVEIYAPPERVWAVMKDVERWAEWTPSVASIELLDRGPLAVGSRVRIRQPKLLPARMQVTEFDEGKGFVWVTRRPGVHVTARHSVEAVAGGTRVTLTLEFSGLLGGLAARLLRDLNQRYLALEANGLKSRSEKPANPS